METKGFPVDGASARAVHESAEAVIEVLAIMEELAPQLEAAQGVLDRAASRLTKPSREELVEMRDRRGPVTPEAFLLARLHEAAMAVEDAWSLLASVDAECLAALEDAFKAGKFPALVTFQNLAFGADQGDLVKREALEAQRSVLMIPCTTVRMCVALGLELAS